MLKKSQKQFPKSSFSFLAFQSLHNAIEHRSEVKAIFESLTGDASRPSQASLMSLDQFHSFLINQQGFGVDTETSTALSLILANEPNQDNAAQSKLSFTGFLNYLTSASCDAYDPAHLEKNMNMKEPLSSYFINSSHNTYLTGHQLTGISSVEMYVQVRLASLIHVAWSWWNSLFIHC